jgi:ABC-type uncharacterized transport system permease subunit
MENNSTQAYGVAFFLLGFVALAAAVLANGSILLILVAVLLIGASCVVLRKAKSAEGGE